MTKARVVKDDPGGRYKAGEIGTLLVNDYSSKYDYFVQLPPAPCPKDFARTAPFMLDENGLIDRSFYFYKHEIEIILTATQVWLAAAHDAVVERGWDFTICAAYVIVSMMALYSKFPAGAEGDRLSDPQGAFPGKGLAPLRSLPATFPGVTRTQAVKGVSLDMWSIPGGPHQASAQYRETRQAIQTLLKRFSFCSHAETIALFIAVRVVRGGKVKLIREAREMLAKECDEAWFDTVEPMLSGALLQVGNELVGMLVDTALRGKLEEELALLREQVQRGPFEPLAFGL